MNFDKFVRRMQKTNHDKKAFLAGIGVVDERIQKSHSAGGGGDTTGENKLFGCVGLIQ